MSYFHQCPIFKSDDRLFGKAPVPGATVGRNSVFLESLRQIALALISAALIASVVL